MKSIHPSALRVALELDTCFDPVKAFERAGGRLGFNCGAYTVRLFGISASCTTGKDEAVAAWVRAVRRKAGAP